MVFHSKEKLLKKWADNKTLYAGNVLIGGRVKLLTDDTIGVKLSYNRGETRAEYKTCYGYTPMVLDISEWNFFESKKELNDYLNLII